MNKKDKLNLKVRKTGPKEKAAIVKLVKKLNGGKGSKGS